MSRLFMIQTSLERRIGAAGRNEQQGLGCGKSRRRVKEIATKGVWADRYGSSVNGALIHANRLAFGRTEGYLCMTLKS